MKLDFLALSEAIIERIEDILAEFDIEYSAYPDRLSMPCPIHGGDNPEGMSILTRGVGNWQCFTQDCHEEYGPTILAFMQALLTVQNSKEYTLNDAAQWCTEFLDFTPTKEESTEPADNKRNKFIQLYKHITKKTDRISTFWPKELATRGLDIPAQYYIDRGYCPEVLARYDVGYCGNPNKTMYNRAVVPCYDDSGEYCVGYSGRIIHPACERCKLFHPPNSPCPIIKKEKDKYRKWLHSSGFNASNHLYNYHLAKGAILETGKAVLVEGPGCIWRLEEAGIHSGLALLGSRMSDEQKLLLECSGATTLVLALDMDEAGTKVRNKIIERCNNMFNIIEIDMPEKDLGEMSVEEVKKLFDGRI